MSATLLAAIVLLVSAGVVGSMTRSWRALLVPPAVAAGWFVWIGLSHDAGFLSWTTLFFVAVVLVIGTIGALVGVSAGQVSAGGDICTGDRDSLIPGDRRDIFGRGMIIGPPRGP